MDVSPIGMDRKIQLPLKPVDESEENKEQSNNVTQTIDYSVYVPKEMRKAIIPRALL